MTRSLLLALPTLLALSAAAASAQDTTTARDSVAQWRKLDQVLGYIRGRSARDYALTGPDVIDEGKYVRVGGIEQWITIRGENRKNPVVLLLHGGPGDATNPWGYAGFRLWLKDFTVVQWDQRGAGRTLGRNGPSLGPTITIERMVDDGIELTEELRRALGQDRIILVGHSWGSILGVLMAKARPDLFHAFVGTGQVADPARNYAVAYEDVLREARRRGDERAVRELTEVGAPPWPNGRGYAMQRRWANLFEGADGFIASMLGLALAAPGYSVRDINDWLDGQGLSAERLVPLTSTLEAKRLSGDVLVPVIVIQGAHDFTTPPSLAMELVASMRAPHKEFATVPGGHFAVFMQPEAFVRELTTRVLPLVRRPAR